MVDKSGYKKFMFDENNNPKPALNNVKTALNNISESLVYDDPDLTYYVGDVINLTNNTGGNHPLYIVSALNGSGGYSAANQVGSGVTNQGATSGVISLDLSQFAAGTYWYVCGNHSEMKGKIIVNHDPA